MTPEELDGEEAMLPLLMARAVREAAARAAATADRVVRVEDGFLVEVLRDGTKTVLKPMAPWTPARVGEIRVAR